MFVQTNSVSAIKKYFNEKLKGKFSESEVKLMFREFVMKRLNISSGEYLLSDNHLLSESDLLYFREVANRLIDNEPFQYIIGSTEFFNLNIKTDSRALIPRPETEELVDWIANEFNGMSRLNIIDLCTGTGCIALGLKSLFSNSEIHAIDVEQEAISLAKENSASLSLPISLSVADVLEAETYAGFQSNSFDCWVSNPPYIPFSDESEMHQNVLAYEPHVALFVENEDPLVFYRKIGENALQYLKPGGKLFFELHENLAKETILLLQGLGFVNIELRKDLQGKDRMLKVEKP